jgi:hypothetical protein
MLTYETVKNELAEIVNANPHRVYKSPIQNAMGHDVCMYFHDDKPGCIVGHWFARHGITAELVNNHGINAGVSAINAAVVLGIEIDSDGLELLAETQSHQDAGMTWQMSLAHAVEGVEG